MILSLRLSSSTLTQSMNNVILCIFYLDIFVFNKFTFVTLIIYLLGCNAVRSSKVHQCFGGKFMNSHWTTWPYILEDNALHSPTMKTKNLTLIFSLHRKLSEKHKCVMSQYTSYYHFGWV
jgi:hypothetical protein